MEADNVCALSLIADPQGKGGGNGNALLVSSLVNGHLRSHLIKRAGHEDIVAGTFPRLSILYCQNPTKLSVAQLLGTILTSTKSESAVCASALPIERLAKLCNAAIKNENLMVFFSMCAQLMPNLHVVETSAHSPQSALLPCLPPMPPTHSNPATAASLSPEDEATVEVLISSLRDKLLIMRSAPSSSSLGSMLLATPRTPAAHNTTTTTITTTSSGDCGIGYCSPSQQPLLQPNPVLDHWLRGLWSVGLPPQSPALQSVSSRLAQAVTPAQASLASSGSPQTDGSLTPGRPYSPFTPIAPVAHTLTVTPQSTISSLRDDASLLIDARSALRSAMLDRMPHLQSEKPQLPLISTFSLNCATGGKAEYPLDTLWPSIVLAEALGCAAVATGLINTLRDLIGRISAVVDAASARDLGLADARGAELDAIVAALHTHFKTHVPAEPPVSATPQTPMTDSERSFGSGDSPDVYRLCSYASAYYSLPTNPECSTTAMTPDSLAASPSAASPSAASPALFATPTPASTPVLAPTLVTAPAPTPPPAQAAAPATAHVPTSHAQAAPITTAESPFALRSILDVLTSQTSQLSNPCPSSPPPVPQRLPSHPLILNLMREKEERVREAQAEAERCTELQNKDKREGENEGSPLVSAIEAWRRLSRSHAVASESKVMVERVSKSSRQERAPRVGKSVDREDQGGKEELERWAKRPVEQHAGRGWGSYEAHEAHGLLEDKAEEPRLRVESAVARNVTVHHAEPHAATIKKSRKEHLLLPSCSDHEPTSSRSRVDRDKPMPRYGYDERRECDRQSNSPCHLSPQSSIQSAPSSRSSSSSRSSASFRTDTNSRTLASIRVQPILLQRRRAEQQAAADKRLRQSRIDGVLVQQAMVRVGYSVSRDVCSGAREGGRGVSPARRATSPRTPSSAPAATAESWSRTSQTRAVTPTLAVTPHQHWQYATRPLTPTIAPPPAPVLAPDLAAQRRAQARVRARQNEMLTATQQQHFALDNAYTLQAAIAKQQRDRAMWAARDKKIQLFVDRQRGGSLYLMSLGSQLGTGYTPQTPTQAAGSTAQTLHPSVPIVVPHGRQPWNVDSPYVGKGARETRLEIGDEGVGAEEDDVVQLAEMRVLPTAAQEDDEDDDNEPPPAPPISAVHITVLRAYGLSEGLGGCNPYVLLDWSSLGRHATRPANSQPGAASSGLDPHFHEKFDFKPPFLWSSSGIYDVGRDLNGGREVHITIPGSGSGSRGETTSTATLCAPPLRVYVYSRNVSVSDELLGEGETDVEAMLLACQQGVPFTVQLYDMTRRQLPAGSVEMVFAL